MRITPRMLFLAGAALVSFGVVADTLPTVQMPQNYFLGQSPTTKSSADGKKTADAAAIEKPAAVNGSLYGVVAPTYSGNTISYLRLFNGGSATANFSITVVGSPSGNTYGVGSEAIPTLASPQFALSDILTAAGAGPLANGDTSYSLYIQSTEPTAGYAHVIYNQTTTFFENVTVCANLVNQAVKSVANSAVLTNIHTSLFAANYPATVIIHNYSSTAITYKVTVIQATSGAVKGSFNLGIAANASYSAPFSFFEQSVGWTPTGGDLHANLVITDPSGIAPQVVLGQYIVNTGLQGALFNMSTVCAVNAAVSASSGGGGVGDGGVGSY